MPAYFTCPLCRQKNYGKVESPQGSKALIEECERCGAENIYWVANEQVASLLRKQKDPPKNIAVGVGESSIAFMDAETAVGRNKHIRENLKLATLEAPYSQGKRTKAFTPDKTAIGYCQVNG